VKLTTTFLKMKKGQFLSILKFNVIVKKDRIVFGGLRWSNLYKKSTILDVQISEKTISEYFTFFSNQKYFRKS
jgi:hypothetical protein